MTYESAAARARATRRQDDQLNSSVAANRLLLSRAEACKALGVGESTLARLTREGVIRSHRIGRRRVYAVADLQRWIDAGCPQGEGVRDG